MEKNISEFISFQVHPNLSGFIRKKYIRIFKIQICPNLSRFFWIYLEKNISEFISFQFHPNLSGLFRKKYIRIFKIQICPNLSRFFWIYLEKTYPDLLVSNFIHINLDLFGKNISGFVKSKFLQIKIFFDLFRKYIT